MPAGAQRRLIYPRNYSLTASFQLQQVHLQSIAAEGKCQQQPLCIVFLSERSYRCKSYKFKTTEFLVHIDILLY